MMKDFAVRAIDILARERDSMGDQFELYCDAYYRLAKVYCLKDNDVIHVQQVFQEKLKIDIIQLSNELDPFRPEEAQDLV